MANEQVQRSNAASRAPRIESVDADAAAKAELAAKAAAEVAKPKAKRIGTSVAMPDDIVNFFKKQADEVGLKWTLLLTRTLRDDIERGLTFKLSTSRAS